MGVHQSLAGQVGSDPVVVVVVFIFFVLEPPPKHPWERYIYIYRNLPTYIYEMAYDFLSGFSRSTQMYFYPNVYFQTPQEKTHEGEVISPTCCRNPPQESMPRLAGGNSGCLQSKGPRKPPSPPGTRWVGRMVVSSQKNGWVYNRNRPLFPGDPENFQGVNWLAVSFREGQIAKKNVFWVRPNHLKVCVIFQKLL